MLRGCKRDLEAAAAAAGTAARAGARLWPPALGPQLLLKFTKRLSSVKRQYENDAIPLRSGYAPSVPTSTRLGAPRSSPPRSVARSSLMVASLLGQSYVFRRSHGRILAW